MPPHYLTLVTIVSPPNQLQSTVYLTATAHDLLPQSLPLGLSVIRPLPLCSHYKAPVSHPDLLLGFSCLQRANLLQQGNAGQIVTYEASGLSGCLSVTFL